MTPLLHQPVAVFDAGIGSYAIVAEIQRQWPRRDILYFADRASFPYGGKARQDLLGIIERTIRRLEAYDPSAIVMASNAPSIMVLNEARALTQVPIHGVFPPLAEAAKASRTGHVGIMGVRSLVESAELAGFVGARAPMGGRVTCIDASAMVELVESGAFLFSPAETQRSVDRFVATLMASYPDIDVLTLSSTHLPWLRTFFKHALPEATFLDPAATIVAGLGPGPDGSGRILGLVTEDQAYDLATFRRMLAQIGVDIPLERAD